MSNQDTVLSQLLSQLVSIDSSYPQEEEISDFLFSYLKGEGFNIVKQKVASGRYNLFAEKGKQKDKKAILFYGHLDTVDTREDKNWKTDPLRAVVFQNKLYGLGASDMKGGIAAFLVASEGYKGYVKILLTVDEENISEGAWKAVKQHRQFFDDVELIISGEPAFGKGLNMVATERTGRAVYEIIFKGKTEHIIKYKDAVDALEKLTNFGHRLYQKREKLFKSPNTMVQIRKISGESKGLSVAGEAVAEIEAILGAEDSVEEVRNKLQALTEDKVLLKPRRTPYLQGYRSKDFPHRKQLAEIIKKNTDRAIVFYIRKSVADDNVLATLRIPVITWGATGGNEHSANEYVDLKSLEKLSKMYREFLEEVNKN